MREDLRLAVHYLRLGMEGQGNTHLSKFLAQLQKHLEDPATVAGLPLERILLLLSDLIAGQHRGDYLRVADLLEYELFPLLFLP
jgi:hypothetical protein